MEESVLVRFSYQGRVGDFFDTSDYFDLSGNEYRWISKKYYKVLKNKDLKTTVGSISERSYRIDLCMERVTDKHIMDLITRKGTELFSSRTDISVEYKYAKRDYSKIESDESYDEENSDDYWNDTYEGYMGYKDKDDDEVYRYRR
jgi:hypothetical protein